MNVNNRVLSLLSSFVRILFIVLASATLYACALSGVRVCDESTDCATETMELSERLSGNALFIDRRGYAVGLDAWLGGPLNTATWYDAPRSANLEDAYIRMVVEGVEQMLDSCKDRPEIVVYIHGGLKSNRSNFKETVRLLDSELEFQTECRFPILVNWRSGAFSTYKDHAVRLRQGRDGGVGAKLSSPIYVANDLAQSVVGAPKAWLTQGTHSLQSTVFRDDAAYDQLPACDSVHDLFCKPHFDTACSPPGWSPRPWQQSALWLATSPVRFVTTPFVYNAGKPAWDVMLHRTNTLLFKACELNGNCTGSFERVAEDSLGHGALSKLMREIQRVVSLRRSGEERRITTLVGHSMGVITINRIVTSMPKLKLQNIVFLAAADSIRNTHSGVLHYLEHNPQTKFYSWMLHPRNEARELEAYGIGPSGSLLIWIDHMYTTPESPLDYRFGRFASLRQFPELFSSKVRDQVHLFVFPLAGATAPRAHGHFNDCKFWDRDLLKNIAESKTSK